MKAFLRLKGKIRPRRKLSAISYQPSEMSCQLSATSHQQSALNGWQLVKYFALDKARSLRSLLQFILVFFVSCSAALAQESAVHATPAGQAEVTAGKTTNTDITPLKIGDKIPDELWEMYFPVVSANSTEVQYLSLGDFKDKLIILDFWATWCGSCIKKFPTLYSLQEENEQYLKVILVNSKSTRDDSPKIKRFLTQRQAAYKFTSITEDITLKKYFPHNTIPHYVWINGSEVIAISNADGITKENIERALNGKPINASTILKIAYNPKQPLFENGNGGDAPKYMYRSILAAYVNGLERKKNISRDEEGKVIRATFINTPLLSLYKYAYPSLVNITPTRIFFETKGYSASAKNNNSKKWETGDLFNYEVQFLPTSEVEAKELIKEDLRRFFNYNVNIIEKKVSCWVLSLIDAKKLTDFPESLSPETNLYDESGLPIYFNNYPLTPLVHELERIYQQPFIDETGLEVSVKLALPEKLVDPIKLQSSLWDQGLSLKQEQRSIKVAVFSNN